MVVKGEKGIALTLTLMAPGIKDCGLPESDQWLHSAYRDDVPQYVTVFCEATVQSLSEKSDGAYSLDT